LEGFILPEVRSRMKDEVSELPTHHRLNSQSAYGDDTSLGKGMWGKQSQLMDTADQFHPLLRQWQQDVHVVAGDMIPPRSLVRQLYESPVVANFFSRVLGVAALYKYDDEFQDLNVFYHYDSGQRAWHYDGSDFIVTLLLQQSTDGGEFEFAPFIRGGLGADGRHDERFDEVSKLFAGKYPGIRKSRAEAGTITLFNGKRSLHRIRASYGPEKRIVAVFSYDTTPPEQQTLPWPEKNIFLHGQRVRAIYEARKRIPPLAVPQEEPCAKRSKATD